MENIQFKVEVSIREARDGDEAKAYNYSSNERKFIYDLDYHLACDQVKRKIIQPQVQGCVELICFALNTGKGLED